MINRFDDIRYLDFYKKGPKDTFQIPDIDTLITLSFNLSTKWDDDTLAKEVLEYGKIPPLGVKEIHKLGITGKGVNVAIIDQPLALNHPEYKDRIVKYKDFCPEEKKEQGSFHGPAVASLLAGKDIGSAPGVNVYYASVPQWLGDAKYEVAALNWILEINKSLKSEEKIKFVSVSAAVGDPNSRAKNHKLWLETVKKAKEEGVCVVDCTEGNRFISIGYIDYKSNTFHYGFPNNNMNKGQINEVHVPNSLRTIAESYNNITFSYSYEGKGGLSWGIPYAVGVLCLAQQVNNSLSAQELKNLLIDTASKNDCIIDPVGFIQLVKEKHENNINKKRG